MVKCLEHWNVLSWSNALNTEMYCHGQMPWTLKRISYALLLFTRSSTQSSSTLMVNNKIKCVSGNVFSDNVAGNQWSIIQNKTHLCPSRHHQSYRSVGEECHEILTGQCHLSLAWSRYSWSLWIPWTTVAVALSLVCWLCWIETIECVLSPIAWEH